MTFIIALLISCMIHPGISKVKLMFYIIVSTKAHYFLMNVSDIFIEFHVFVIALLMGYNIQNLVYPKFIDKLCVWSKFPLNTPYVLTQEVEKPFLLNILMLFTIDSSKESSLNVQLMNTLTSWI